MLISQFQVCLYLKEGTVTLQSLDFKPATLMNLTEPGFGQKANLSKLNKYWTYLRFSTL